MLPRTPTIALALAGAAFVLLASCSTVEKPGLPVRPVVVPDWVHDGRHPEFPDSTHLAAYAASENIYNARREADARLEVLITDEAFKIAGARLENTRLRQQVTDFAAWIAIDEYAEGVRRDFAGDGFEAVSVSAISRGDLKYRSLGLLAVARAKLSASDLPVEVSDAVARLQAWGSRFLLAARVVALNLLAHSELDREALALAEEAMLRLSGFPAEMVVVQEGQNQHCKLMGGTPKDLSLTLSFRQRAPLGLKLRWSVEAPAGGVVSGFAEVNAAGQAFCRVLALTASGADVAYVRASLDLDAMVGRRLGIAVAPWRWQVAVPSRRQVLLDMDVKEHFAGQAADPVFVPACIEWARLNELSLLDDQGPLPAEAFLYRVKIVGSIKVTVVRQAKILVGRAEGELTLVNVETGEVLFRYSPSALLEAAEESNASDLAKFTLREAAGDALLEFGARVLALFPAAPSEKQ